MVKNPPNNLWIIAAVLAPIAVVTLIIIIITAVLCRKNKNDFKADAIGNLNPRVKVSLFSLCICLSIIRETGVEMIIIPALYLYLIHCFNYF